MGGDERYVWRGGEAVERKTSRSVGVENGEVRGVDGLGDVVAAVVGGGREP